MPSKSELVPPDQTSVDDNDKDFEEVTETRIVGVTKSGVIRKRSFKRKVTKEEKSKLQGYGKCTEEYEKIRLRVLNSKMILDSIETLKERLKMIKFMHEDCMDLVSKWQETRDKRLRKTRNHDIEFLLIIVVVGIILAWFLFRCLIT